jgi:hypothetical protein
MAVPQYTETWQNRFEGNLLEYENTDGFPMYSLDSIVRYFNAANSNPRIYNYFVDAVPNRSILIRSLRHILSKEENRRILYNDNMFKYTLTTGLTTLIATLKTRQSAERRNMDVDTLSGLLKKIISIISSPHAGGRRMCRNRTYKRAQKRKHTRRYRNRRHA